MKHLEKFDIVQWDIKNQEQRHLGTGWSDFHFVTKLNLKLLCMNDNVWKVRELTEFFDGGDVISGVEMSNAVKNSVLNSRMWDCFDITLSAPEKISENIYAASHGLKTLVFDSDSGFFRVFASLPYLFKEENKQLLRQFYQSRSEFKKNKMAGMVRMPAGTGVDTVTRTLNNAVTVTQCAEYAADNLHKYILEDTAQHKK